MKRLAASALFAGLVVAGCQSPGAPGPSAGPARPAAAHVAHDAAAARAIERGSCPQDAERAAAAAQLSLPEVAERQARTTALAVRAALAAADYPALSKLVSARGVCLAASKGADCRWMRASELAGCAANARREVWAVDSGADEPPRYSCAQAMRKIFWAHPGLATAEPSFNCFRARADNSGASLARAELGAEVYVELFADDPELPGEGFGWRSLWLLLAPEGGELRLVGLVSHYWSI